MEETKKPLITLKHILIVSGILLSISLILSLLFFFGTEKMKETINFFISTIKIFSPIFLGLITVEVVKNYPIRNNPYFPTHTRKKNIKKIINKYDKKNEEFKETVFPFIKNLQNEKYRKYTNDLQELDLEFLKLWNDFNYFSIRPNLKDKEFFFKLQRAVYFKVYEYGISLKQEV